MRFFWSLAGIDERLTNVYLRKQNDELQWIHEALRPCTPPQRPAFDETDLVYRAWGADQVRYFAASAIHLSRKGR